MTFTIELSEPLCITLAVAGYVLLSLVIALVWWRFSHEPNGDDLYDYGISTIVRMLLWPVALPTIGLGWLARKASGDKR